MNAITGRLAADTTDDDAARIVEPEAAACRLPRLTDHPALVRRRLALHPAAPIVPTWEALASAAETLAAAVRCLRQHVAD